MWQDITIWLVIAMAVFFIGRRLYRQWRVAFSPGASVACGCGCAGCDSICDSRKQPETGN
jgi:putative effector of murein hydrolase